MQLLFLCLSLLSVVVAGPVVASREPNVIWLCGDSTMAPDGGHNGTQGWGQYLQYSLDASTIRVNNSAYAGRSARTFTREGRFQAIFDKVKPGDWAVIEFGHNDGPGNPANDTKYRVDCPGEGHETCPVTYNNQTEIVQTYATYLRNATRHFLSKGAKVVISSPTPTNPYDNDAGVYTWTPTIYSQYSVDVVRSLGGPKAGVYHVDHSAYGVQALELMGRDKADSGFPMDNTHTAPWLADVFSRAFVLGVKCGADGSSSKGLGQFIVNSTQEIEADGVLGSCIKGSE